MSVTAAVLSQAREHIAKESVNIFFEDSKNVTPILAHAEMKKMKTPFGRGYIVPVQYGTGFNASFNDTLPTAVMGERDRWNIQPITINTKADWTRDDIDACTGDGETFDVITSETDLKTIGLRDLIAQQLTGRGWGSIGTVLTVNASPAYFTTQPSTINRYKRNMILRTAVNEATAALSGTALSVTSTDPDLNRVYVSASPAGASWVVGDHVFISGSRQDAAPPTSRLSITGIMGWVDTAAPGASDASPAALHGITRAGWELGGHRIDAASAGLDHETALIRAANRLKQFSGVRADTCFVSNSDWEIIAADKTQVKTLEIKNAGKYTIAFSGIEVVTDGGTMKVVPDAYVPQGTAWCGPFEDGRFAPFIGYSGDGLVNIDDKDGMEFRRKTDGTVGYEMVLYSRCQYIVPAPGMFCAITGLPTP